LERILAMEDSKIQQLVEKGKEPDSLELKYRLGWEGEWLGLLGARYPLFVESESG